MVLLDSILASFRKLLDEWIFLAMEVKKSSGNSLVLSPIPQNRFTDVKHFFLPFAYFRQARQARVGTLDFSHSLGYSR